MASKFKAGMLNFIEVLNQMWDAFAAGPYNAVPLTGGVMTGSLTTTALITPKVSCTGLSEAQVLNVGPVGAGNTSYNAVAVANPSANKLAFVIVNSGAFFWQSGAYGVTGISAMDLNKNATNNRSMSVSGTLNANGADYAEYMIKRIDCTVVAPGQIIGIDAEGKITDRWGMAVSFAVKSTNPCLVGGDTWATRLGERPVGDQTEYNAALEVARQKVDRIAFAGQVPVNLQGTAPGQFIVPVQDGDGIGGRAVDKSDMTLDMLMDAIGRVIAIEDDGRARIIVKVA